MHSVFLGLHIISGSSALLTGMIAILARKKKGVHTGGGIAYYFSMLGTAVSAVILAVLKWNPFLLSIGIFAFYLTYTGRRAIWFLRLKEAYVPGLKDKLLPYAGIVTGICMLCYPLWVHYTGGGGPISVLQVFGGILISFSIRDSITFADKSNFTPHNKKWLIRHITSMGGAYISTLTAFLVVNINFSPAWVVWLAPTAVGSVLITMAVRRRSK